MQDLNTQRAMPAREQRALLATLLFTLGLACSCVSTAPDPPMEFETPQAGADALVNALRAEDLERVRRIFGQRSADLVESGDAVSDRLERERFLGLYDERHGVEPAADGSFVLVAGNDEWPFPIPLVEAGGGWIFDVEEGRVEMLARRIGRNELDAIQVCLAGVDAQHEYAAVDRDDDGLLEFAQKFRSAEGQRDGLFWPTTASEEPSPLGEFAAAASREGYSGRERNAAPRPYHGYHYQILNGQGEHAPGGAYDYLVRDSMVGGFALLAYPARYGNSGVMSFLVNHEGVVWQNDLGADTNRIAVAMRRFDPDASWKPVDPR